MGILRVDHPDIVELSLLKKITRLTNFNISVGLTDDFMQALAEGKPYELVLTVRFTGKWMPGNFDLIVKYAWKNGEPGIVFRPAQ